MVIFIRVSTWGLYLFEVRMQITVIFIFFNFSKWRSNTFCFIWKQNMFSCIFYILCSQMTIVCSKNNRLAKTVISRTCGQKNMLAVSGWKRKIGSRSILAQTTWVFLLLSKFQLFTSRNIRKKTTRTKHVYFVYN